MKTIQLTQGKSAIVDDDDFERLSAYKWSYLSSGYARRAKNNKCILMHREIINAPDNLLVDHINMNTLDNRKENLRLCTQSQNMANKPMMANSKNKYKGAFKHHNGWKAEIFKDGVRIYLGYFKTQEEAADAYKKAAAELFGEFARY